MPLKKNKKKSNFNLKSKRRRTFKNKYKKPKRRIIKKNNKTKKGGSSQAEKIENSYTKHLNNMEKIWKEKKEEADKKIEEDRIKNPGMFRKNS